MDKDIKLANIAHEKKLGNVSMYIWEACCVKYGVGGTPASKKAYYNIMKKVFEELGINY